MTNLNTSDPNWLSTPLQKIVNKIDNLSDKNPYNKFAILLTTGAFCPIHEGHIEMMELAKKELEDQGICVLGGYLSPANDEYVKYKCKNTAISASHRIVLCNQKIAKNDWLMVDKWESYYNDKDIYFTYVIKRLKRYISKHIKKIRNIDLYYVFGADNADFVFDFTKEGRCICIQRPSYENNFQKISSNSCITKNIRIILSKYSTSRPNKSSSSMKIPDLKERPLYPDMSYLIRDEGNITIENWTHNRQISGLSKARENLLKNLKLLIKEIFYDPNRQYNLTIQTLKVNEQYKFFKKNTKNTKNISLDLYCKDKYVIDVSREFAISDNQENAEKIIPRPNKESLSRQIKKIPAGKYVLIDDDAASRYTLSKIRKMLLGKNIKIKSTLLLSRINNLKKINIFDVIDFRDFLIGSRDGGLVVTLPNGKIVRSPYTLPYVSNITRAKIPPSKDMFFSIKIWELNKKFFKSLNPPILLKETDKSFQQLMKYIGFKSNTPMENICDWHLQRLKNFN